jgi:hypothetical protein
MKLLADIGSDFFQSGHSLTELKGVGDLVSLLIKIIFVFAGVSLLLFFIIGGIGMIAGAGGSDPEKMEKSKKSITSALIGFLVVFVAYWIVQLIEILTGIKIL